MRKVIFPLVLLALVSSGKVSNRIGVMGGFPQMAAVAYQYTPYDYTTLEIYAGTLVINGTVGGRLIISRTDNGFSPRTFAGFCVFDQWYGDNMDDAMGTASYFWTGAGLGWNFPGGFTVFGDISWLYGGDRDKGLGYSTDMNISGGLLFPI